MQYKEFRSGLVDINTPTASRLFEETCSGYRILSFDVVNSGSTALTITNFGGWDSLAQKLYSNVYSQIAASLEFQNSLTAEAQNNMSIRFRRFENISTSTPGSIAAGTRGLICTLIDDCQIFWCNAARPSGSGAAEALGIFKGALEGVSSLFEVVTDNTGKTPWIDCRAYGSIGFEVVNTGSQTQTAFTVEIRRHPEGGNSSVALFQANFSATNPLVRYQRIRSDNGTAQTPGGRSIVDFNIEEAHSIRFTTLPITGQLGIKGVLKG
jgi:hypothetical protein